MPDTEPTFSVVIPLFNKKADIARCLRSVCAQTMQDFEIVVVDDGSTDGSADEVAAFATARLKLIRQPNRGLADARNRGVAEASSAIVAFLDADDEWLPGHLEQLLTLVERAPQAAVYCTAFWLDRGRGVRRRVQLAPRFVSREIVIEDYLSIPHGKTLPSALAVRKSAIEAVGGFRHMFGEDIDLLLRLSAFYPIAYGQSATAVWHLDAQNRMCVSQNNARSLHQPGSLRESLEFVEKLETTSARVKANARGYVMRRERDAISATLLAGDRVHAEYLLLAWREEFIAVCAEDDQRLRRLFGMHAATLRLLSAHRRFATRARILYGYARDWQVQRSVFRKLDYRKPASVL